MHAPIHRFPRFLAILLLLSLALAACGTNSTAASNPNAPVTVRLGYFPNITHAAALVGIARGTFAQALGKNTLDASKTFNAGPALMEALTAGDIDIGYAGPSPAINTYVQTHGDALRIIAGASSGGVELVVRPGANIKSASDLQGKKIADPQTGGTQDISLRHYLQQHNLKPTDQGGNVQIIPTDNSTILNEFKAGQIDGAWVPEPWASSLVDEAKGVVLVDERTLWPNDQFATTIVVVRTAFLDQHPDVVKEFLEAHVETVQFINSNPAQAQQIANQQLQKISGKALSSAILTRSFSDLSITYDPLVSSVLQASNNAYALGDLGTTKPDLSNLFSLDLLNSVLTSKGLQKVSTS
jgi:NitT/TauT family transport system substrate-binding protein